MAGQYHRLPHVQNGRPVRAARNAASNVSRSSAHGHCRTVALLVLLARAAGTGIVASDLDVLVGARLRAHGSLHLGWGRELDPRCLDGFAAAALLGELLLGDRLVAVELLDNVV